MTGPRKCVCGRARCTKADLQRWQDELDEWTRAGHDARKFNPEWARALCWTTPDVRCQMRPLQ